MPTLDGRNFHLRVCFVYFLEVGSDAHARVMRCHHQAHRLGDSLSLHLGESGVDSWGPVSHADRASVHRSVRGPIECLLQAVGLGNCAFENRGAPADEPISLPHFPHHLGAGGTTASHIEQVRLDVVQGVGAPVGHDQHADGVTIGRRGRMDGRVQCHDRCRGFWKRRTSANNTPNGGGH